MSWNGTCLVEYRGAERQAMALPSRAWQRISWVVCVALSLATLCVRASAQDLSANPFAVPPAAPADTPDVPAPPDQPAAEPEPQPIDPSQYGPAVQAVLERPRTTPAELLEGILLLVELGEPELAQPWLDQLAQAPPDAQTQADLARQFGSHRLMRLSSAEELGEAARDLAASMMEAYAAAVRDPERISRLIDQLASPTAEARYTAIAGLMEAGQTAAAALVAALDDISAGQHRAWLHVALVRLSPESIGPLLAGLEADAATIRAQSATILGRLAPAHLAPRLLSPALADEDPQVRRAAADALQRILGRVPTPDVAEAILRQAVEQHLDFKLPLATDEAGQVEVWYWDRAEQRPAATRVEVQRAHVYAASRLARDLVQLVPTKREYVEQDLMLQLAAGEIGQPLGERPASIDGQAAQQVTLAALEEALRRNLPQAIVGTVRELARKPDGRSILLSRAPAESPLVRALVYPNEAVRWEAVAAIMQLEPGTPFPGASRLTDALADFVESGPRPRAVAAMPTIEKARNLAARLDRLGYEVTLATTGREAILAAAESGGADLVLIDAKLGHPSLREVLYQIRANPRSSGAAVGVLGIGERLEGGRELAEEHRDVQAFPHPLEDEAVAAILERLAPHDDLAALADLPPREERARQALAWLGELLQRGDALYGVRKYEPAILDAADDPALMETSVGILARLGSHESQRRLVELASSRRLPIELREQAAEAFRATAQQHGVQLTSNEILRQYDRYNASETADRATQAVLGHVLDTIEMRREEVVRK